MLPYQAKLSTDNRTLLGEYGWFLAETFVHGTMYTVRVLQDLEQMIDCTDALPRTWKRPSLSKI